MSRKKTLLLCALLAVAVAAVWAALSFGGSRPVAAPDAESCGHIIAFSSVGGESPETMISDRERIAEILACL